MTSQMTVLLFCPTRRLEPETITAIFAQRGEGLHFLFTRDNPERTGKENVLRNYRAGRKAFLAGDYEAMFVVESDIIPPPDALQKLLAVDADVAKGLYCYRHGHPVWNAARYVPGATVPDQSLSLYPELREQAWGKVVRISGGGLGCALIHRHVLEALDFRPHEGGYTDWAFDCDLLRRGFVVKCDTTVRCGHKRPDGLILWPTADGWTESGMAGEVFVKIRMLVSVGSPYGSPGAGDVIDLPPEIAEDWINAGYAEKVKEDGVRKPGATEKLPRNKRNK